MTYDTTKPAPPDSLTPERRQLLDSLRSVAEAVRDDADLFAATLAAVLASDAPTPQLLALARMVAFRLVRSAGTADSIGRSAWTALAGEQQASGPAATEQAPTQATATEQTGGPPQPDMSAAGLYQRRGVS